MVAVIVAAHGRLAEGLVASSAMIAGPQEDLVAVTFDPHPALVHRPDQYRGQIMGTSDKLDAMEQLGVDAVLVQHYDLAFASQDPLEFMRRYLLRGLRACCVVVGADARFGRGNQGDVSALRRFGAEHGHTYVNGVLDKLAAEWRGVEMQAARG